MNVLVTGAYGFVGTNLCRFLAERGHSCAALDIVRGEAPYASFYTWDQLAQIPWASFDAVVHLAGKAHDTKNASDPQSYFDINLGLTQKVFAACGGKVRRFIFFSSVKACADTVDGVLTEETPCAPATPYGQSKLAAEKYLREKETPTTDLYILRPAMIHGPGNKGNLNLLCKVVRHGFPWPLGAFENERSFTSIGNACAVVEALCAGKCPSGTYQLADDAPLSTNLLIELIAEAAGRKARIWQVPKGLVRSGAKAGDWLHLPLNGERLKKLTESYVVSNAKLKRALGWETMPISAEDGMKASFASLLCE